MPLCSVSMSKVIIDQKQIILSKPDDKKGYDLNLIFIEILNMFNIDWVDFGSHSN